MSYLFRIPLGFDRTRFIFGYFNYRVKHRIGRHVSGAFNITEAHKDDPCGNTPVALALEATLPRREVTFTIIKKCVQLEVVYHENE